MEGFFLEKNLFQLYTWTDHFNRTIGTSNLIERRLELNRTTIKLISSIKLIIHFELYIIELFENRKNCEDSISSINRFEFDKVRYPFDSRICSASSTNILVRQSIK